MPGAAIDTALVSEGHILPPAGIASAINDHVRKQAPPGPDRERR
jgi:hypothetical protein